MTQDSQPEETRELGKSMGRRAFLTSAATAMAASAALAQDRDYGPNAPPVRYPEPDVLSLDKRFDKYKIANTPIQRLHTEKVRGASDRLAKFLP